MNEPLAQQWSYDKYENRFEADDEHQRSIVSNSVLIYVNASESLGDVSANLCIIYFMAVGCLLVSLNRNLSFCISGLLRRGNPESHL